MAVFIPRNAACAGHCNSDAEWPPRTQLVTLAVDLSEAVRFPVALVQCEGPLPDAALRIPDTIIEIPLGSSRMINAKEPRRQFISRQVGPLLSLADR